MPKPAPPTPDIFVGAAFICGIAAISGSVTFARPVLTMRFIAGALIVLCIFAICTLCSIERSEWFGVGGPPLKVSFRFGV